MTTANIDLSAVEWTPGQLTLSWQNSTYSVYTALWLRDNDPANRDAETGQRRISLLDLPPEPRLRSADARPAGHITLSWEDGAISIFSLLWLRAFDQSLRTGARPTRMPWMGQPSEVFAACDYEEWITNPASRRDSLYYAGRDGLAFLSNVPTEEGAVLRVGAQIGFVREANFGSIFDVCTVASPRALVGTGGAYRDPVPGFQLLHCLSATDGACIFVDGMTVAEDLRVQDSDAFSTLCQTPITFRSQGAAVDLVAERTMLDFDTEGQFRAIYYNEDSMGPLPLKGPRLRKYYPAYRRLAQLLRDTARLVVHPMQPGNLVLFDNSRVLHGCAASLESRLQGCYVDADGLYSSLAVLSRPSR
jgi:alpha-ketoglutarate-dependent taurine dioxygenase